MKNDIAYKKIQSFLKLIESVDRLPYDKRGNAVANIEEMLATFVGALSEEQLKDQHLVNKFADVAVAFNIKKNQLAQAENE